MMDLFKPMRDAVDADRPTREMSKFTTSQLLDEVRKRYNALPTLVREDIVHFIHEYEALSDPDDDDEEGNHGRKPF